MGLVSLLGVPKKSNITTHTAQDTTNIKTYKNFDENNDTNRQYTFFFIRNLAKALFKNFLNFGRSSTWFLLKKDVYTIHIKRHEIVSNHVS